MRAARALASVLAGGAVLAPRSHGPARLRDAADHLIELVERRVAPLVG